jgi:hypothetical protein
VQLTIEISHRGLPPPEYISKILYEPTEYGVAPVLVETYDPRAMAASKVAALVDIRRTAPATSGTWRC